MLQRKRKETVPRVRAQARRALAALKEQIPEPRCELDHRSAWELLVATILSAQTTDRTVNKVTPALFARFPTPAALAAADPAEVEALVRATGFFRSKARAIQEAARGVVERFGGEVPREMDSLTTLRGVARKTANVVLGTAFGVAAGVTVDVHASRVSQRLGLTRHREPAQIEADLMALFPRAEWIDLGHRLVLHGRYTCTARAPRCGACACRSFCPAAKKIAKR
jgi:endonuclease-3